MLSVLLETMHEDVNAVSKKPYIEQKDSDGRPDHVVAGEFWDGFLQRERSIFVKLFYGQLKSRVQCSLCKHVSITFDPFNVLSVPIPKQSHQMTKVIDYYPLSFVKPVLRIKVAVSSEDVTANELKQKVREAVYQQAVDDGEDVKFEDISLPIICVTKNKLIIQMARGDLRLSDIESGFDIVAVERQKTQEALKELIPINLIITQ